MRVQFLPLLCVVNTVLSAPHGLVARDISVIDRSIKNIQTGLKNLSDAVAALNRPFGADVGRQGQEIERRGQQLKEITLTGANDVRRAPPVDFLESAMLIGPVEALAASAQAGANVWIAAKNAIIKSGGRDIALRILRENELAGEEFTDAMIGKLPEAAKYIGRSYGQRVKATVDSAINQLRY